MAKRSSDVVIEYVRHTHSLLLGHRTASEMVLHLVRCPTGDRDL